MAACLDAKGWDVRADSDGGVVVGGFPEEQHDRFLEDQAECLSEHGSALTQAITAEEAERLWDELLAVAECVRALGYHVPEPPSRQAAVEALQRTPIMLEWWPHDGVPPAEQNRSYAECPPPAL